MKKQLRIIITLLLAYLLEIGLANATVHIINAQGTTIPTDIYVPAVTNAIVGDTITWIWISGIHTTESTTIPVGALPWASDLNSTTTTFSYVVTIAGTYNFTCHASTPHGMDGTIIVTNTTGIPSNDQDYFLSAYPNPCSDKITIETSSAEMISIYSLAGQKIKSVVVKNGQAKVEMDVADLSRGIYFVEIFDGKNMYVKRIIVE